MQKRDECIHHTCPRSSNENYSGKTIQNLLPKDTRTRTRTHTHAHHHGEARTHTQGWSHTKKNTETDLCGQIKNQKKMVTKSVGQGKEWTTNHGEAAKVKDADTQIHTMHIHAHVRMQNSHIRYHSDKRLWTSCHTGLFPAFSFCGPE